MSLHATINQLASGFAHRLLSALRSATLDEIHAETSASHTPTPSAASRGKRVRRSAAELEKDVARIVAVVRSNADGINAEAIRAALKVPRKELPRPLAIAVATKQIRKRGAKRATLYFM